MLVVTISIGIPIKQDSRALDRRKKIISQEIIRFVMLKIYKNNCLTFLFKFEKIQKEDYLYLFHISQKITFKCFLPFKVLMSSPYRVSSHLTYLISHSFTFYSNYFHRNAGRNRNLDKMVFK
jgi:hypothetical protein